MENQRENLIKRRKVANPDDVQEPAVVTLEVAKDEMDAIAVNQEKESGTRVNLVKGQDPDDVQVDMLVSRREGVKLDGTTACHEELIKNVIAVNREEEKNKIGVHLEEGKEPAVVILEVVKDEMDAIAVNQEKQSGTMVNLEKGKDVAVVTHEKMVRDVYLDIMGRLHPFERHLTIPHVCKDFRMFMGQKYACVHLNGRDEHVIHRVYLSRVNNKLIVEEEDFQILHPQVPPSIMVNSLDEFVLYRQSLDHLCVIDQKARSEIGLPKLNNNARFFLDYSTTDAFCLLYHQKTKKYKVLHVGSIYKRGCNMGVRCQILTVHNAFKDLVESSWKRIHVPVGFESWEFYMSDYVTIDSKLLFWDVRKHKYMVKFDIRTLTFTKIEHLKEEWDVGSRRFLFEDRGQLLMFYITMEDATVYILNDESRWEYVKKFDHSEDWNRWDHGVLYSPFLSSSVLFGRFLLYMKPRSEHVWCFDLVKEVSSVMDISKEGSSLMDIRKEGSSLMDIGFRHTLRGDTLSHSFSARS